MPILFSFVDHHPHGVIEYRQPGAHALGKTQFTP